MGGFWSVVGAIATDGGTLIAAIAASLAAFFTYRIMQAGQKQVELSQAQNQQTLESERDTQLPVLMPTAALMAAGYSAPDGYGHDAQRVVKGYDRTQPFARVAVKNVGPGIALNVWGVIFEPEPESQTEKVTGQHHVLRYDLPILPGVEIVQDWKGGGLPFTGDATLDTNQQYKLYAPPTPALGNLFLGATEMNARLTLTYADIFGRKHAAIYDLTTQFEWVNVAYLRNTPKDLHDLVRETQSRIPVATLSGLPFATSE